jgi:hypothetical protein
MRLFDIDIEAGTDIVERVDAKYKPVFDKIPPAKRAALARYFLPYKSKKQTIGVTRPRVAKWYCTLAGSGFSRT